MAILVRWVHPYKVKKDDTLKPSAFRDADVVSALVGPNEQGCDKKAISLADFSFLTHDNKSSAKGAACKYCAILRDSRKEWKSGKNCDCTNGAIGVRGAFVEREDLERVLRDEYGLEPTLQPDTHPDNPLHTLLCFCKQTFREGSYFYSVDEVQRILIKLFSSVDNVQSLFNNHE